MKSIRLAGMVLLMLTLAVAAEPFQKDKTAGRLLTGKVVNHQDVPLSSAIVYLSNVRNRAVKTYIVGQDGSYRFPELSPNIDYEVYAQFDGKKSDTKTMSQFDNRPTVTINLKIDAK